MDGGILEGTFNGQYFNGGSLAISDTELHGTGGAVDGLVIKVDAQSTRYLGGLVFTDVYTIYILTPMASKTGRELISHREMARQFLPSQTLLRGWTTLPRSRGESRV